MKYNPHSSHLLSLIVASSLLAPVTASAALLFGFHDFDATATTEVQYYGAHSLLEGVITKTDGPLSNTGGSSDKNYADGTELTGTNDGFAPVSSGSPVTFTITNTSENRTYSIDSLLLDASHNGSSNHPITISYLHLGTTTNLTSITTAPVSLGNGNYGDFERMINVLLGAGDSIAFTFNSAAARLDNIGATGSIVAVPEPGSLVAIGGLIGSGLFLRSRSRRTLNA